MNRKDLTGKRFGRLTALEPTEMRRDGYRVWRCRCDCGGEVLADTKRLARGTVTDCGCVPKQTSRQGSRAEDLAGQTFGDLTVVSRAPNRNGRVCWLCRCVCGREKEATAHDLKSGKVKSCGCRKKGTKRDLGGQRFGRLTALYPTERRTRSGSVYWHCRCDCGGETEVSESGLVYGGYKSCGCLQRETRKQIPEKLHLVDGTCVEMLEKRKHRSDNKSGFRGVNLTKNGKYRVSIGFQRKRYYIGMFASYEEAVAARVEAEQQLHGEFLKAYRLWEEKAGGDPKWKESHPFSCRVERSGKKLSLLIPAQQGD